MLLAVGDVGLLYSGRPSARFSNKELSLHTKTAFLRVRPVCEPPHVMPPDFLLYTLTHTYTSVIP